ncbi:MAG: dTDP-4-dehydrorhamnose 3,5-epimerase, partial [Phycisphaerae bacterium]|nr:dTDP-4-dehydrorhamnose 3,5-epimerase [Phycisphaerae bacterium]
MEVMPLAIPDVKVIVPVRHGDHRGYFSETYNRQTFASAGIEATFVQDNQSLSARAGTIRALHYQIGAMAQAKLIRVLQGSILDVAVDIRRSSPTFGKHAAVILSAENWKQVYVPIGFAHGFVTLEPNTVVFYKVTSA